MDIGSTVKRLRLSKKMTQEELAEKLGVTVQSVSRWENDVNYPDITVLPLLAELFSVSTDMLLGVHPEKKHGKRKLLRTVEVFELETPEDARALAEEFEEEAFPRMTAYHIDCSEGKVTLTVEKEFGVDLNKMEFKE